MPLAPHSVATVYERSRRLADRFRAAGALVVRVRGSYSRDLADAPTVHWGPLTMTEPLAVLGQQAARMLRLQAWAVLGPMLLLSALHAMGLLPIELPRWLLAPAFALIGWRIGLSFRRDALFHAAHAPPAITAAALSLMGICGPCAIRHIYKAPEPIESE